MKKLPIALQLYSVRDDMAVDFEGTLQKVAEMGYDGVEFAGLLGHSVGEIQGLMGKYHLQPISAHVPYEEMAADPEGVLDVYAKIGCQYVAIPYLREEHRPGAAGFEKTVETIRLLGETAHQKGMVLLYHNHDFEFVKFEGKYSLDVLYERVPSELLQTEQDTCWVRVAGEDPVQYLLKYTGRAPIVHLKDFSIAGEEKTNPLYEVIGTANGATSRMTDETFSFRPVGHGIQDIPAIVDASVKAGASWVVVEMDRAVPGQTLLRSAQISVEYLRGIGL